MEVFLAGIGHCFGFRYLAGDVGGFAQLVYEFHVFQYLPGVVVHVFFQLFEHGRGAVECEKRILFSQLEFLADGGYFLGLVEVVDNAFLYIILRQVFFFRSQLLADTFQLFFEILDHFGPSLRNGYGGIPRQTRASGYLRCCRRYPDHRKYS